MGHRQYIVDYCVREAGSSQPFQQANTVTVYSDNPVRTLERLMARDGLEVSGVVYQEVAHIWPGMRSLIGGIGVPQSGTNQRFRSGRKVRVEVMK